MFESLGMETSLGLNLKVGKDQHKDDNKFFWKLPSKFHLYTIGVVVIPNDCGVSVGQEFCSVFYTSVS